MAAADDEELDALARRVADRLARKRRRVDEVAAWASRSMPLTIRTFTLVETALHEEDDVTQVFHRSHLRRTLSTLEEGILQVEEILVETETAWEVERHGRLIATRSPSTLPEEEAGILRRAGLHESDIDATRERVRQEGLTEGRFVGDARTLRPILREKASALQREDARPRKKWFKGLGKVSVGLLQLAVDAKMAMVLAPTGLVTLATGIKDFTEGCGELRGE